MKNIKEIINSAGADTTDGTSSVHEMANALFSGLAYDMCFQMARESTSKELLSILSYNERFIVREYVAKNLHTSPQTLEALAQDKDLSVRCAVLANRNTPREVISNFIKDLKEDNITRWDLGWIAGRETTSAEILTVLADSKYMDVREAVETNRNTPKHILPKIKELNLNDPDLRYRRCEPT